MNTVTLPSRAGSTARALWLETETECARLLRMPESLVPTIAFPAFFYTLFGLVFDMGASNSAATYYLAMMGSIGVIGTGLMGTAIGTASERSGGWLDMRRVMSLPRSGWVVAKLVANLFAGLLALLPLFFLAAVFGEVRLNQGQWIGLALTLLIGGLPFCAIGLMIGSSMGERAAIAIANLIFLPMLFFSGLMIPLAFFPDWLQGIAPLLPAWHLGELALMQTRGDSAGQLVHWLVLLAWAGLASGLSAWLLRRSRQQ
ncbi:ABC transporter permease [Gammaproteobacteria bacterium AB-CW1]|uniref:ABC transporter permease n=1 Tax=Natronospira elongata TaxID=3110268 RepID=A0AAP6JHK1_9GAMM|nr:ABC transporter permease [Gammaproteobacteria bacterium AB-CW1]